MTIEQEARERSEKPRDTVLRILNSPAMDRLVFEFSGALKAKQDRIKTLESALKEICDAKLLTWEWIRDRAKKALGGASCE